MAHTWEFSSLVLLESPGCFHSSQTVFLNRGDSQRDLFLFYSQGNREPGRYNDLPKVSDDVRGGTRAMACQEGSSSNTTRH